MSEVLFVNGAIQNRGYDLDQYPGKAAGIFLATVLNQISGNPQVLHLWNNVGTFNDSEPFAPTERINQKYNSLVMRNYLKFWELGVDDIQILNDDNEGFCIWSIEQLSEMLDHGDLTIENADFTACLACELVIAEAVVKIDQCPNCNSERLLNKRERALFVYTPENRALLLDSRFVYNSMNLRDEIDSLKQIPDRLLLSRDRTIGVGLENVGLENKKLDPRFGIGMLALYGGYINDFETVAMTQTTSTLIRTAPYVGSVIIKNYGNSRRLLYAPHMRINKDVFEETTNDPAGLYVVAAFASAQRREDVKLQRYESASKEFSKFARNVSHIRDSLKRLGIEELPMRPEFIPDDYGLTNATARLAKDSGVGVFHLKKSRETTSISDEQRLAYSQLISIASSLKLID